MSDELATWTASLDELLAAARGAVEAGDATQRAEVRTNLLAFMEECPNGLGLDDLAYEAIRTLVRAEVGSAIQDVAERTADLVRLSRRLGEVATANRAAADAIRLTKVKKAVDSLSGAIVSVKDLKSSIEAGADGDKIRAAIDRTIRSIQSLRSKIEGM